METIGQTPPEAVTFTPGTTDARPYRTDADTYRLAAGRCRTLSALVTGGRLRIDGVECIVTSIEPDGITTRPVTEAD